MGKAIFIAVVLCVYLYEVHGCGKPPPKKPGTPPPKKCRWRECHQTLGEFSPMPKVGECVTQKKMCTNKFHTKEYTAPHNAKCRGDGVCKAAPTRRLCKCVKLIYGKEHGKWEMTRDDGTCKYYQRTLEVVGRKEKYGSPAFCRKVRRDNRMDAGKQTDEKCVKVEVQK